MKHKEGKHTLREKETDEGRERFGLEILELSMSGSNTPKVKV